MERNDVARTSPRHGVGAAGCVKSPSIGNDVASNMTSPTTTAFGSYGPIGATAAGMEDVDGSRMPVVDGTDQASYILNVRLSQIFDPIAQIGLPSQLDNSNNAPPSPAPGGGGLRDQMCRMSGLSDYDQRASTASSSSIHSVLSDFAGELEEVLDPSLNTSTWALLSNTKDVAAMFGAEGDCKNDDGSIDWQERCLELELALERFRDHAGKVRDIFNEKLADMETRVLEAETRAERAEGKVREMEHRLGASGSNSTFGRHSWMAGERTDARIGGHAYDGVVVKAEPSLPPVRTEVYDVDKDKIICSLQSQVEEQRLLRLQDAKQVEAKAARIKEWVTNKLRDLEEQNTHLRMQNQKCNDQISLLRGKLGELSQMQTQASQGIRERVSTEDSSRGSYEGSRPESDESGALGQQPSRQQNHQNHRPELKPAPPVYAEIDYQKKNGAGPRRTGPPKVLLERKKFSEGGTVRVNAHGSSTGSSPSEELPDKSRASDESSSLSNPVENKSRDSKLDSSSMELETPSSLSPRSPHPSSVSNATPYQPISSETDDLVAQGLRQCEEALRSLTNGPLAESLYQVPPADRDSSSSSSSSRKPPPATPPVPKPRIRAADEWHDYAEIYTPSGEKVPPWVAPTNGDATPKPPTPPLHRCPSWESRIYKVATSNEGFTMSGGAATPSPTPSRSPSVPLPPSLGITNPLGPRLSSYCDTPSTPIKAKAVGNIVRRDDGYCPLQIPVFATVKGRASQIRAMPFSGDESESDSSDGGEEDCSGYTGGSEKLGVPSITGSAGSGSASGSGSFTGSSFSPSKPPSTIQQRTSPVSFSPSHMGTGSRLYRRENSVESGLSDDYAVPPDAYPDSGPPSVDSTRRNSAVEMTPSRKASQYAGIMEKSGQLTKLSGKLKTWNKRWFVLKKEGVLCYWKSQSDVSKRPQGVIVLDENCRVNRAEGASTFEIVTGKKTYYLTADSTATMEEWVRILQNVMRKNSAKILMNREDYKPVIQGWISKVKHGHSKRCWCSIAGKIFLYFRSPSDTTPLGHFNLKEARIQDIDQASDSSEENDGSELEENVAETGKLTIAITPPHQGPTYLLFPTKAEKDQWLYHMTVVSGASAATATQFEQLVEKLMDVDGDLNNALWKHPMLLYSKDSILSPLTTLSSEMLQTEAVKLFKSCQLFMSVPVDSAGIDYHVVLAQNALQLCLDQPELQGELICGLAKQTGRHITQKFLGSHASSQVNRTLNKFKTSSSRDSSTSLPIISASDSKANPPSFVLIQGWQLLALAVSLFLPKNSKLLWYLKVHLGRNSDNKTEIGKYACYCQRALQRTTLNGPRDSKPSRMEVLSILLKNPYHHSLPHAIPVHLANGSYQVVGFDGSTTVEEFLSRLCAEVGVRDPIHSGFALYSDDPLEKDLQHHLLATSKICDLISRWETCLREKGSGKFETTRAIRLHLRLRLYWASETKHETERERLLICFQINEQIKQGMFPVSKNLALELTALMAQMECGDCDAERNRASGSGLSPNKVLEKFFPIRYREGLTAEQIKLLFDDVTKRWRALRGHGSHECMRTYLNCVRKWPFFAHGLFIAELKTSEQPSVWLSVGESGITLLDYGTLKPFMTYAYPSVITFGGCEDDFMLVVVGPESYQASVDGSIRTEKLLFAMSKPKILEVTLLIADYMNAGGHLPPETPNTGTLTRHGSVRLSRRSVVPPTPKHNSHAPSTDSDVSQKPPIPARSYVNSQC